PRRAGRDHEGAPAVEPEGAAAACAGERPVPGRQRSATERAPEQLEQRRFHDRRGGQTSGRTLPNTPLSTLDSPFPRRFPMTVAAAAFAALPASLLTIWALRLTPAARH